jgi:glycosyltransferase involved in cell wall biosynthesis
VITTVEPEVGGPSYSAVNAAVAEQDAGVTTVLASTVDATDPSPSPPQLVEARVAHRRFPRPPWLGAVGQRWGLSVRFALWVVVRARRADIVHVHYVWSLGTLAGVVGGLLWRRPVVMTPHESLTTFGIATSRSRLRRHQKLMLRRLLLAGISRVIVASDLELRDSELPRDKGRVIHHPVPTGPVRRRAQRDPRSPLTVGYLGRLHPKKRIGDLLEVLPLIGTGMTLAIGGSEPPEALRRLRNRVAEAPYAQRVDLRGFVDLEDREAFFASVDVLVMPSAYECFGMVAAEAMSAGVPVVVTDQTGIADLVREFDAGAVVPVGAPEAIAAALTAMASDPDHLSALGSNARRAADERLSFAAYAGRVRSVYEEVVK